MSGAEQVQDNRDAEVSDQEPEGDVHHLADAAACSGHESRAEECEFAASSQLSSCTPEGIAGPPRAGRDPSGCSQLLGSAPGAGERPP